MNIKVSPALIVPLIVFYCAAVLSMLVFHVRNIEVKVQSDPHNCAYYVNTVEHRGQHCSTFAGFAQENINIVKAEFYNEVLRVEQTYGLNAKDCTAESCPDSVEIILYSLCDTSSEYSSAVLDVVVFK